MTLPAVAEGALRFLLAAGSVRPGELAGLGGSGTAEGLDLPGALVLVRRLIREGVLEIVQPISSGGAAS